MGRRLSTGCNAKDDRRCVVIRYFRIPYRHRLEIRPKEAYVTNWIYGIDNEGSQAET